MQHVVGTGSVASSDSGHSTNSSGDGPGGLPHSYQSQPRCPSPPRHPPPLPGMYYLNLFLFYFLYYTTLFVLFIDGIFCFIMRSRLFICWLVILRTYPFYESYREIKK